MMFSRHDSTVLAVVPLRSMLKSVPFDEKQATII